MTPTVAGRRSPPRALTARELAALELLGMAMRESARRAMLGPLPLNPRTGFWQRRMTNILRPARRAKG